MTSIFVTLTDADRACIAAAGARRQNMQDEAGHADGKVLDISGDKVHVQGATGEYVVMKGLRLLWDGEYFDNDEWQKWRRLGHDVSGLEVKYTEHEDGGLLLRKHHRDDAVYVLVRPRGLRHEIAGWMYGREGKQAKYWREDVKKWCWIVPDSELRPIEEVEAARQGRLRERLHVERERERLRQLEDPTKLLDAWKAAVRKQKVEAAEKRGYRG